MPSEARALYKDDEQGTVDATLDVKCAQPVGSSTPAALQISAINIANSQLDLFCFSLTYTV